MRIIEGIGLECFNAMSSGIVTVDCKLTAALGILRRRHHCKDVPKFNGKTNTVTTMTSESVRRQRFHSLHVFHMSDD